LIRNSVYEEAEEGTSPASKGVPHERMVNISDFRHQRGPETAFESMSGTAARHPAAISRKGLQGRLAPPPVLKRFPSD
jgi:hypothetical protein